MKHRISSPGLVAVVGIAALVAAQGLFVRAARTPVADQQAGGIPTFQLDPSWPKVPEKWKLGDASSVAIDEQDHVWVLHRPRTLPTDQMAKAAPPVLEFDAAGNFIQAWAVPERATNGLRGSMASLSIPAAMCGLEATTARTEICLG